MVSVYRLELSEPITVRAAGQIRNDLLSALSEHDDVVVDLASDHAADLCGIQLLEAARIYARSKGKRLRLAQGAGGAVLEALERGGCLQGRGEDDRSFWLEGAGL
jgi:MFS superfamily sulfate permease-like transporter